MDVWPTRVWRNIGRLVFGDYPLHVLTEGHTRTIHRLTLDDVRKMAFMVDRVGVRVVAPEADIKIQRRFITGMFLVAFEQLRLAGEV